MDRKNIFIAAALGIISFVVYLFTLPASISTGDSGEIAAAVYSWGVAHPTGFPTYIILAKLFSYLLPGLEFAHRLNIFSALSSAVTLGILFLILQKLKISRAAGLAAAFSLAFADTFWLDAQTIQVYSLTALFFVLSILLFLKFSESGQKIYFYFLALAAGFGAGTHLTFLLIFPFLLIFSLFKKDRKIIQLKSAAVFSLIFAAALILVYSYIPLRANQSPPLNWGDPKTKERFIYYLTQRDYAEKIGSRDLSSWGKMLEELARRFSREFTLAGVLLIIFGMILAFKKERPFFYAGLSVIIFNILLLGNYGSDQDIIILYRYFLPSYIVMAIFLAYTLQKIFGEKRYVSLVLILPLFIFVRHFQDLNKRDNFLASKTAENILASVPTGSLLISGGDTITGALMYRQIVLKKRDDVVVVDGKLFTHPWYQESKKAELEAKNLEFAHDLPSLISENYDKGVYSISNSLSFLKRDYKFYPRGIIYKIYDKGEKENLVEIKNANESLWQKFDLKFLENRNFDKEFFSKELVVLHIAALNNLGAYYFNNGLVKDGIEQFEKSLSIRENKNALYNLANIYNEMGTDAKALEYKRRFEKL